MRHTRTSSPWEKVEPAIWFSSKLGGRIKLTRVGVLVITGTLLCSAEGTGPQSQAASQLSLQAQRAPFPHSQSLGAVGRGNGGAGECRDTGFGWRKEARTLDLPSP